jgi:hypothetical protein
VGGKPRRRNTASPKPLDLGNPSVLGTALEWEEVEAWLLDLRKDGYVSFYSRRSRQGRLPRGTQDYPDWLREIFPDRRHRPDLIAVHENRTDILVGDVTAGPWSSADIRLGGKRKLPHGIGAPSEKRPHLEKTIEDAEQLARKVPDYITVHAQDRYREASDKSSRRINVTAKLRRPQPPPAITPSAGPAPLAPTAREPAPSSATESPAEIRDRRIQRNLKRARQRQQAKERARLRADSDPRGVVDKGIENKLGEPPPWAEAAAIGPRGVDANGVSRKSRATSKNAPLALPEPHATAAKGSARGRAAKSIGAGIAGSAIMFALGWLRARFDDQIISNQIDALQPDVDNLLRVSLPRGMELALREPDEGVYATVVFRISQSSTGPHSEIDPPYKDLPVVFREDVRVDYGLEPKNGTLGYGSESIGVAKFEWTEVGYSILLDELVQDYLWPEAYTRFATERGSRNRERGLESPLRHVTSVPQEDPVRNHRARQSH